MPTPSTVKWYEIKAQAAAAAGPRSAEIYIYGNIGDRWDENGVIAADMVLKAIGQKLGNPVLLEAGFAMQGGRLATAKDGATSLSGVWAGGDCRAGGLDLTVEAAAHGKASAQAIHRHLCQPQ